MYRKILVRDLDSPFFIYDWTHWERPSGIRQALEECYQVVRVIPGIEGDVDNLPRINHSGPVSVLVPREGEAAAGTPGR